jgi:hypothetical protein
VRAELPKNCTAQGRCGFDETVDNRLRAKEFRSFGSRMLADLTLDSVEQRKVQQLFAEIAAVNSRET